MAPNVEGNNYVSTIGFKVPRNRADHLNLSGDRWLSDKSEDDGAEGLWRVHDKLYDLSSFIDKHPGGPMWLQLTKGTDITEAFETHHISPNPEHILSKYYVRQAQSPRNSPFTFHKDGFYKQLKEEVREALDKVPKSVVNRTKWTIDVLLLAYITLAVLASVYNSYIICIVAGMSLACLTVASHNFFHQKDSFRMYYFDLSLMSSRDWRISHALSHHLYTNTIIDLEIQMFEPLLPFLPMKKSIIVRYFGWLLSPIFYVSLFPASFVKRMVENIKNKCVNVRDIIPFFIPLSMYVLSNQSILQVIWLWGCIVLVGSFHFATVGINAAHHRPDIFHDGDAPRRDTLDWGISQLDAVMDRSDIDSSSFLVLTNFGEHGLHHLFPTLDHAVLPYLRPAFESVCARHGVRARVATQLDMIKGQFRQLVNATPNPAPPCLKR